MKKSIAVFLANSGVLAITNHNLDPAHAYKVVKFRKALSAVLDAITKDEDEIRKDSGVGEAAVFNKELRELRETDRRSEEQDARLRELEATLKRFNDLRDEMMKEEVTLDCKALPYEQWHKLQCENKARDIGGRIVDVLSGVVEDELEGILWIAPEE